MTSAEMNGSGNGSPQTGMDRLLEVMRSLRTPKTGCQWDLAQTFDTIAPYTLEEAYEVADAISRQHYPDLKEELGDLLFQVAFHARMAEEAQLFGFDDVAHGIAEKMIRRHPHVFSDVAVTDPAEINARWEAQKAQERQDKNALETPVSSLDGVALNLPALTRAAKIQGRAKRVGFDWDTLPPVIEKVREEIDEVLEAVDHGEQSAVEEEVGDLLFAVVNLSRHTGVDPETALRKATVKFSHRFAGVERLAAARGLSLDECELEQLDALWDAVKSGSVS